MNGKISILVFSCFTLCMADCIKPLQEGEQPLFAKVNIHKLSIYIAICIVGRPSSTLSKGTMDTELRPYLFDFLYCLTDIFPNFPMTSATGNSMDLASGSLLVSPTGVTHAMSP